MLRCASRARAYPRTEGSLLRRRTRIALFLTGSAVTAFAIAGGPATQGAPSVTELRSEVARIQAEVSSIDDQVGLAAEAYNGAVYNLGQVNTRIDENRKALKRSEVRLHQTQDALAVRLRAAYVRPQPSRIQLLLTQTSTSQMLSASEVLERAADQDRRIVTAVKDLRNQRIAQRRQLVKDREDAKKQVEERRRQRQVVTELLARRQAVLAGAKGRLAQELEAEQRREAARRAAEDRRARAMMRAQSRERQTAQPQNTPAAAPAGSSGGGSSSGGSSSGGSTASAAPAASSSGSSSRNARAAQIAMGYMGVPYVWGGASPSGFDCSGLAMYAYAQVGVSMGHYTGAIWSAFPRVQGDLQVGDLVFFNGLGHMGIYIGNGMMVHAPHTGDVVRVASISRMSYMGAVRP